MKRVLGAALCASVALGCSNRGSPPAAAQIDEQVLKPVEGLAHAEPVEGRSAEGRVAVRVGHLAVTLPAGWTSLTIAGQTTYRSPDFGESLRVIGYTSPAPMERAQQEKVLAGVDAVARRAEAMMAVIGATPTISPSTPTQGAAWLASTFTVMGPLNRLAFHHEAVSAHEAMLLQLDGNTETPAATDALAVVRSLRFVDIAALTPIGAPGGAAVPASPAAGSAAPAAGSAAPAAGSAK